MSELHRLSPAKGEGKRSLSPSRKESSRPSLLPVKSDPEKVNLSPIKKRQRINDISFNSIRLRYLNSVGNTTESSIISSGARSRDNTSPARPRDNINDNINDSIISSSASPAHKQRVTSDPTNTPVVSKESATTAAVEETQSNRSRPGSPTKKNIGKFNFLTDIEVSNQIQTIVNNEVILKNLLLSIVSSVKSSKESLQELSKNSQSKNNELTSIIKSLTDSKKSMESSSKEFKTLFRQLNEKSDEDKEAKKLMNSITISFDKFQPVLESLSKDGGFSNEKQVKMTYDIIKANRAEALSIINEISSWKSSQDEFLKKLQTKIASGVLKPDTTKDTFVLLSNISQLIEERFHLNSEKERALFKDFDAKIDSISTMLLTIQANTASNQDLSSLADIFTTKVSQKLNDIEETLLQSKFKNEDAVFSLADELKQEMKKQLVEKLVTDEDMKLLNDRLNKWSSQVDKNISQLLVSSLNSKFQKSLSETIKDVLVKDSQALHNELTSDRETTKELVRKELQRLETDLKNNLTTQISKTFQSQSFEKATASKNDQEISLLKKELENQALQTQIKDQKILELQQIISKLKKSIGDLEYADKVEKSITTLETKSAQLKSELAFLNETYRSRYEDFDNLLKKHNDLMTNFNNMMLDKYKNIFGASAMVLLNKNNIDSNITSAANSPYNSPSKSLNGPKVSKKVLSPIRNRVVTTTDSLNVGKRKGTLGETLKNENRRGTRNFSLNLENTQEEKENY